jgi:hypothetical protein
MFDVTRIASIAKSFFFLLPLIYLGFIFLLFDEDDLAPRDFPSTKKDEKNNNKKRAILVTAMTLDTVKAKKKRKEKDNIN